MSGVLWDHYNSNGKGGISPKKLDDGDYWRPELQHKIEFKRFRVMDLFGYYTPEWFSGPDDLKAIQEDCIIVGKVRPWDRTDNEYVLYGDGDFYLAEAKMS